MNHNLDINEAVIISKIYVIRDQKVMLDEDLAELYDVETKRLNEQVKRNINRFPEDFMFELTKSEYENLKSQNATARWGGRRTLPYAFTEHGVLMLSSVLKSEKAVSVNIRIMRTFIRMRELLLTHKDLILKVEKIERQMDGQGHEIKVLFEYIKRLIEDKEESGAQQSRKRIGYKKDAE